MDGAWLNCFYEFYVYPGRVVHACTLCAQVGGDHEVEISLGDIEIPWPNWASQQDHIFKREMDLYLPVWYSVLLVSGGGS